MNPRTYAQTIQLLENAEFPIKELRGRGCIAVIRPAARIIAMAFSPEGSNLLWTNPQLENAHLLRIQPEALPGGFGGDRLWFAPELAYHWRGQPDWDTFNNYRVPTAADPGDYRFVGSDSDVISLSADIELPNSATGERLRFRVQRSIRMTPAPLQADEPSMRDVDYVGIETSHTLELDGAARTGCVDLWHLLQAPAGSFLIVPLDASASVDQRSPLSYGMPGNWVQSADRIEWRYGGIARAKCGLSAHASTGRAAVLQRIRRSYWCLIVRDFSVNRHDRYADHPYEIPRSDQAFQAWDGFGFGEMEYHSPMAHAADGPREINESDRLWAFGGPANVIADLARRLLGFDTFTIPELEYP